MPASIREDLLTSFLDPLIWPFGCRAERQRQPRHLYVGNMRVSVDGAGFVYRTPLDRAKNRAGIVEGPLFAFQARHETRFWAGKSEEEKGPWEGEGGKLDRLDVLREVGALLVLAQERARDGVEEVVPGRGKWWAEKRRWGGGSGEAIGKPLQEDEGGVPTEVTDVLSAAGKIASVTARDRAAADEEKEQQQQRSGKRKSAPDGEGEGSADGGESTERNIPQSEVSAARDRTRDRERDRERRIKEQKERTRRRMIAQSHEMPRPLWDKRVEYRQLGRDRRVAYDDVSLYLR